MAFTLSEIEAGLDSDGKAFEKGLWDGDSVTTGTITAGGDSGFPDNAPKIGKIELITITSDTDDAVMQNLTADDALKLTFTSSDTGRYYIKGSSAGV